MSDLASDVTNVAGAKEAITAAGSAYRATQHRVSNVAIEFAADGLSAIDESMGGTWVDSVRDRSDPVYR